MSFSLSTTAENTILDWLFNGTAASSGSRYLALYTDGSGTECTGGTYARAYFTAGAYEKLVIDIVDVDQPAAYVEASRLICGAYWAPEYNPGYGATARVNDTTANTRSQSGDLRSDVGTVSRSLSINLEWIAEADRPRLWNILRGSAKSGPVFISLFPEDADPEKEQAHQIYGKLASDLAISHPMFGIFSGPLEVEEV